MKTDSIKKERLYSLDTLRGFDMFWIMGGAYILEKFSIYTEWGWAEKLSGQFEHVEWIGFHFFDLIFPLFMFIAGVAIPYALKSKQEKGVPKNELYKKIFKRMVILFLLGLAYNGIFENGFANPRFPSVLAQIGISYFFAALISINTNSINTRIYWVLGILATVSILQLFVSIDGYGGGNFTMEYNINSWVDQHFLPGDKLHDVYLDALGYICTFSAIAVTLLGSVAGTLLRSNKYTEKQKVLTLLTGGAVLIVLALIIAPVYPIIKKMWTASFDLLTAGLSSVLLGLFYYIIDVKKKRGWIFFFQVIGLNSITIYLAVRMFSFWRPAFFLFGWIEPTFGKDLGEFIISIVNVGIEWAFLYCLYKKKMFLRV